MCRIVSIAGDMKDWIDDLYILENWVKEQGCHFLGLYGRKGWKKILKEYDEHCILFRKKL